MGDSNASLTVTSNLTDELKEQMKNVKGTYTITYTVSDNAGNTSSKIRTVIVEDTIKPVITLTGQSNVIHTLGTTYTDAGATATDNVDSNASLTVTSNLTDELKEQMKNVKGTYTITYTVSDNAGNTSSKIRTVVVKDTIKPVITLNGSSY